MGTDDINAAVAHVVLGCVAANGCSRWSGRDWTHPGMHTNFFVHSILGLINYSSSTFGVDVTNAYRISYAASKYLPIPCLMADICQNRDLSIVHAASGILPFILAVSGKDNAGLGNLVVACNIAALCHYSFEKKDNWGWYTALSAAAAYFLVNESAQKFIYPLALAVTEYCAYRVYHGRGNVFSSL